MFGDGERTDDAEDAAAAPTEQADRTGGGARFLGSDLQCVNQVLAALDRIQ